jgi:K+-sensing histidine kinase KdpD
MSVALSSKPKIVIKNVPTLDAEATKSIRKDEKFVNDLPKSYSNLPKSDLAKLTKEIDQKIEELIKQRDVLLGKGGNGELVAAKNNVIQSLQRERSVINLSQESNELKDENTTLTGENDILKVQGSKLKKYLYATLAILFVLILIIAVILQRKKIQVQDVEIDKQLQDINKKNSYLEYAARLIRHDMHSGINTYMPRGLNSLEKKLTDEDIERLKLDSSIKMIKEGLTHTQKVYKSVYEFTNLVKQNVALNKTKINLKDSLDRYLSSTSYSSQVEVNELTTTEVNEQLFCGAIDNLIKNGLKYNDSKKKSIKIYMEGNDLIVEDNGRGMSQQDFEKVISVYSKKKDTEDFSGLGLNICVAILEEHGFEISCEKVAETGTRIKINIPE